MSGLDVTEESSDAIEEVSSLKPPESNNNLAIIEAEEELTDCPIIQVAEELPEEVDHPLIQVAEELPEEIERPGSSESASSENRPSSVASDCGTERRKRRQKTLQSLQCVRCHAFDFPNFTVFHDHHLLHAYESFLIVALTKLPEEEDIVEDVFDAEEMKPDSEEVQDKRGPIKLTIKFSSCTEKDPEIEENIDRGDENCSETGFSDDGGLPSDVSPRREECVSDEAMHETVDNSPAASSEPDNPNETRVDRPNENLLEIPGFTIDTVDEMLQNLSDHSGILGPSFTEDTTHNNSGGEANIADLYTPPLSVPGETYEILELDDIQPLPTTKCAPCAMSFFSSEDLQRHVEGHHGDIQKCCRCNQTFERIEDLIGHVRDDHPNDLNQEPDRTPVPVRPKTEPREPKTNVQKLRVIPSAQLMSSPVNTAGLHGHPSNFNYNQMQPPISSNIGNMGMHMSQNSQSMATHNQNINSMMHHISNVTGGAFANQLNGVLSSVPVSQSYPFNPTGSNHGQRMYMQPDHQNHGQPSGTPILQSVMQQNPGQMVRIPRQQIPNGYGMRIPNFRGGTPVQGRGRPLAPVPRSRYPRPQMQPNIRQTPPYLARKRSMGPQGSIAPPQKQARNDSDDIEVVAVKQRPPSQQSVAESHGLPRLPNSISVSVKTVNTPDKPSEGGSVLASVLANRGITVTPASSDTPQSQNHVVASIAASLGPDVSVSSAANQGISRTPQRPTNNFVAPLPPGPRSMSEKDRPPRPPTVDLTVDQSQKMYTCQACKRKFPDVQKLKIHLESHINPSAPSMGPSPGGAFICNVCNSPYHSQHALEAHRQLSHPPRLSKADSLAIPIVDLSDPGVTSRLAQLGIKTCLPVGRLASLGGGSYGIPLVSIDSRGSSNFPLSSAILTLGTIQNLP